MGISKVGKTKVIKISSGYEVTAYMPSFPGFALEPLSAETVPGMEVLGQYELAVAESENGFVACTLFAGQTLSWCLPDKEEAVEGMGTWLSGVKDSETGIKVMKNKYLLMCHVNWLSQLKTRRAIKGILGFDLRQSWMSIRTQTGFDYDWMSENAGIQLDKITEFYKLPSEIYIPGHIHDQYRAQGNELWDEIMDMEVGIEIPEYDEWNVYGIKPKMPETI